MAVGWDHVAFLLALVLLATTLGELVGVATAFTVAHSLTLGLAVLGMVRPEAAVVEALVGFSIYGLSRIEVVAEVPAPPKGG